jgi:hypothetical protein
MNFFNRMVVGSDEQVYYGIRNSAFVSQKYHRQNSVVFAINKFVYNYSIACYLMLKGHFKRWRLFRKAIADAENGKLGRLDKSEF